MKVLLNDSFKVDVFAAYAQSCRFRMGKFFYLFKTIETFAVQK